MASKTKTPQTQTTLLLTKLKTLRQALTEHGYSQHEFQLYFLTHILGHSMEAHSGEANGQMDTGRQLAVRLKEIRGEEKIREILGAVDREIQEIRLLGIEREDCGGTGDCQGEFDRGKELAKRRRNSKENREKKSKKSKAQKRKAFSCYPNQPQPQQSCQPLLAQQPQPQTRTVLSSLFTALNPLHPSSSSSSLNFLTNSQNKEDTKQQHEKQMILQKLIQIQMLSRLLCGGRGGVQLGGRDFMMRC